MGEKTMSRYRDDRDDYYGARRDYEERTRERGGYYGERGAEPFDSAYGDGRGEPGYRDRDYYRNDYPTGAVGRRGEREDYERGARHPEDGRDRPKERGDGRSLWEEREYFARRGYRRGRTSRSHIRCRDIMTRDVTVATRETTLAEVARMMRDEDTGVIPVVDRSAPTANAHGDASAAVSTAATSTPAVENTEGRRINAGMHGNGRLVGLITDRDIAVRAVAEGRDVREVRAEEIMTADVHTAQPNDRVIDAIRKMGDKQVRRIPIVDRDETLRGIISMADVALETNDDRELAEALEEISSGQSFWNRVFG
jgi:CBS domain-containing protein